MIFNILKKIVICFVFLVVIFSCSNRKDYLTVYSAVNLKNAVDEIVDIFKNKYDKEVRVIYSGSHILLSSILLNQKGDIFISADKITVETAKNNGIISDYKTFSKNKLVIIVSESGANKISHFSDLTNDNIKLAVADDKTSSIGKSTVEFLKSNHIYEETKKNIVIKTTTILELLTPVIVGSVDAAIVYDNQTATGSAKKIYIPDEKNLFAENVISILSFSEKPESAKKFFDFMFSKEAQDILIKNGYEL